MQQCSYKTKVSRKHKTYRQPEPPAVRIDDPSPAPESPVGPAAEALLAILRKTWPLSSGSILGLIRWSCGVLRRIDRENLLSDLVKRGALIQVSDGREVKYHIPGLGGEHTAVKPEGEVH